MSDPLLHEIATDETMTPRARAEALERIWEESTDEEEKRQLDIVIEDLRDRIDDPV